VPVAVPVSEVHLSVQSMNFLTACDRKLEPEEGNRTDTSIYCFYWKNLILKIILNVSGVSMLRELTSIKFSPWFGVCLGTKISYPMQPFSLSHETFLKLSNLRVVQNTTYNFAWSSPQIVSQISPPFGTKVLSSVTMYVSLGVPKAMP
jgi:hypothetical protein